MTETNTTPLEVLSSSEALYLSPEAFDSSPEELGSSGFSPCTDPTDSTAILAYTAANTKEVNDILYDLNIEPRPQGFVEFFYEAFERSKNSRNVPTSNSAALLRLLVTIYPEVQTDIDYALCDVERDQDYKASMAISRRYKEEDGVKHDWRYSHLIVNCAKARFNADRFNPVIMRSWPNIRNIRATPFAAMVLFCIAILSLVLGFTGPHRKTSSATKTALQYAADQVKLAEQRPAEISAENSDDAIPTEYTAEWPRFLAKRDKIEDDYLLRRNNLAAEYPAFRSSLSDLGESGPPQKAIVASSRNIR